MVEKKFPPKNLKDWTKWNRKMGGLLTGLKNKLESCAPISGINKYILINNCAILL